MKLVVLPAHQVWPARGRRPPQLRLARERLSHVIPGGVESPPAELEVRVLEGQAGAEPWPRQGADAADLSLQRFDHLQVTREVARPLCPDARVRLVDPAVDQDGGQDADPRGRD